VPDWIVSTVGLLHKRHCRHQVKRRINTLFSLFHQRKERDSRRHQTQGIRNPPGSCWYTQYCAFLPTYHTAALSTDALARDYFGDEGMLGCVARVQRQEIRLGVAGVKHQNMAGSDMGDDHKACFSGAQALKASSKDNKMNHF